MSKRKWQNSATAPANRNREPECCDRSEFWDTNVLSAGRTSRSGSRALDRLK